MRGHFGAARGRMCVGPKPVAMNALGRWADSSRLCGGWLARPGEGIHQGACCGELWRRPLQWGPPRALQGLAWALCLAAVAGAPCWLAIIHAARAGRAVADRRASALPCRAVRSIHSANHFQQAAARSPPQLPQKNQPQTKQAANKNRPQSGPAGWGRGRLFRPFVWSGQRSPRLPPPHCAFACAGWLSEWLYLTTVAASFSKASESVTPCFCAACGFTAIDSLLAASGGRAPACAPLRILSTSLPVWRPTW